MDRYVPMLLSGMVTPIEAEFRSVAKADGSLAFSHRLFQEGPSAEVSVTLVDNSSSLPVFALMRQSLVALGNAVAMEELAPLERSVEAINESIESQNHKIEAVLVATTGQDIDEGPVAWWNWWDKYNETYVPDKTASESGDYGYAPPYDYKTSKPHYEYKYTYDCFARGTSVWTLTGPQAIETIKPGDRVLSQDPDTGELAYKPVVAATYRPPSRQVVIGVGAEKITATLGHPFWVPGDGWRMAKELKSAPGFMGWTACCRLKAWKGSMRRCLGRKALDSLIVADFNTYFVGEHSLLVHDNTPRRPPAVAMPALLRRSPGAPDKAENSAHCGEMNKGVVAVSRGTKRVLRPPAQRQCRSGHTSRRRRPCRANWRRTCRGRS